MADLNNIQAAGSTIIVGSDSSGNETNPVQSTTGGGLHSNLRNSAGVEITSTASELKQSLDIVLNAPSKQTYICGSVVFSPPALPTDMWTISGSSTKVIKILTIRVNLTQTTTSNVQLYLKRYSTLNTGASTSVDALPLDTNNSPDTATIKYYTANPTLGTLTGILDTYFLAIERDSGTISFVWNFDASQGQPLILRGVNDQISINFNGATKPAGFSLAISATFTEE